MGERFFGYPTGWLLAVIDDPSEGGATAARILAETGMAPDEVLALVGDAGARQLDGLGHAHGRVSRWRRVLQFTTMDQMPDFYLYEAAVREGRVVLAIRAPDAGRRVDLVAMLRRAGAHFINYFGRLATEEVAWWRGPMPDVPQVLRR